jgi:ribosome biogenesis GTPase A
MALTRNAIKDRMKEGIDVVIEMLDARCPGASANPMLAELTQGKPALKVLNKQDLADPARTEAWLVHYNATPGTRAIAMDTKQITPAKALLAACRELAPTRTSMVKPLRLLICGIPNVGKSTLINALMGGKRAAKTGDEPGITKVEQKLVLAKDVWLFDTPGMLWPRISIEQAGYHLAASGAVGRNALDEEDVALALMERLRADYPGLVAARYGLADVATSTDDALLTAIGRKRGAMLPGGRVNLQKAAEVLLYEFRQGVLGRITLETPEQFATWAAAAAEQDRAREAKRAARAQARAKGPATRQEREALRAAEQAEAPDPDEPGPR